MLTAKIFENGRSQAIRLPKIYRFNSNEIYINKVGGIVMLIPKEDKWNSLIESIKLFSDDYLKDGRPEQPIQKRMKI